MSKRPRVVSRKEKSVARRIQRERRKRDAEAKAATRGARAGSRPEPHILSWSRGPVDELPAAAAEWIAAEAAEQLRHYRRIYREQERLAPLRDGWVKEFFARITGPRGFSVHAGTRRTIPKGEIPRRPKRPWRVVW